MGFAWGPEHAGRGGVESLVRSRPLCFHPGLVQLTRLWNVVTSCKVYGAVTNGKLRLKTKFAERSSPTSKAAMVERSGEGSCNFMRVEFAVGPGRLSVS